MQFYFQFFMSPFLQYHKIILHRVNIIQHLILHLFGQAILLFYFYFLEFIYIEMHLLDQQIIAVCGFSMLLFVFYVITHFHFHIHIFYLFHGYQFMCRLQWFEISCILCFSGKFLFLSIFYFSQHYKRELLRLNM